MAPIILSVLAALTICAVAASLTYLLVMELWAATCAQARREFEERPYTWTLRPLAEPVISYFESAGMYGRFEFSSEHGAHIVLMPLYTKLRTTDTLNEPGPARYNFDEVGDDEDGRR